MTASYLVAPFCLASGGLAALSLPPTGRCAPLTVFTLP